MLPAPVIGELMVGASLSATAPAVAVGRSFANPKSSSFAPALAPVAPSGYAIGGGMGVHWSRT
jgi:hypothetical protein